MLLKRNSNIDSGRSGTENIEEYLKQEQKGKGKKPWSKLEKTTKLKKIYEYINILEKKFKLTEKEKREFKAYMKTNLERKKLQRIKDVIYEVAKSSIKDIPGLSFDEGKRKFVLKRVDKKGSTLKYLAPKKKSKTKRNKKKSDKSRKKKNRSNKKGRNKNSKTNKIDKHIKG